MSRVLEIVVVPHHRAPLEWLGYYQPAFFADTLGVLNKLDFHSFINDCVALKAMFEICIGLLGFCNFCYCQRVYFILVAVICKHLIHIGLMCIAMAFIFVVMTPIF